MMKSTRSAPAPTAISNAGTGHVDSDATATATTAAAALRSLRTCYVSGDADGMLGLHLSRAPWDPYPWISSVQTGSSAARAGIRVGDCVLEVNGTDVLGQRIAEVVERIRSKWQRSSAAAGGSTGSNPNASEKGVTFLLWNSKAENNLNPHSLQKFTACLQSVAQLLECPVCLDVVRPPAWQCCHGHVLCGPCRGRSQRCPVCRVSFGARGRCLIADKLFTLLAETFPCENKQSGHKTCTSTAPCSRPSAAPNKLHSTKSTIPAPSTVHVHCTKSGSTKVAVPNRLTLHCPHAAGGSCGRLGSTHELLTHLQRTHHTSVTQYYCNLGDRIAVRFAERSISALAIPKNGQLELFLVLRQRMPPPPPENGGTEPAAPAAAADACWLWYVGSEEVAAGYHVRLECGERYKWRGASRSLAAVAAADGNVDDWLREGCARIAATATSVVVEVK